MADREYGPASRWMIRHVFQAPGGWSRFCGLVLLLASVVLFVVPILVFADDASHQSDRDFFPFITVFFVFLSVVCFVFWVVFRIIAKVRGETSGPSASGYGDGHE